MPLYHVQDSDRPMWVFASSFEHALERWRERILAENDGDETVLEGAPDGVHYIADDDELIVEADAIDPRGRTDHPRYSRDDNEPLAGKLSVRVLNALEARRAWSHETKAYENQPIRTVGELRKLTNLELRALRNIGETSLREIQTFLAGGSAT